MFYACYIKWFPSIRVAFQEAADLANPTFRIRTLFQANDPSTNYTALEESFIKESTLLGNTSGCIAEQILPVIKEVKGKYWVHDREWAGRFSASKVPFSEQYYHNTNAEAETETVVI